MEKIAYTVKEASQVSGIHIRTLYRLIKLGQVRAINPVSAKSKDGEERLCKGEKKILHKDLMTYLETPSEEVL